jgi:Alr-MurF fusion protein
MIKANQIPSIINCKLLSKAKNVIIDNLLFDSRKISHPETSLFIAIVTERRNGHRFIKQVYEAGVRCFFVCENENYNLADAWIFLVDNPLEAIQALVTWHRNQFAVPVIGITGSNGKTIVKEWLNQLLESDYNIVRSPKSYNSQIGVPLSVWQMNIENNLALFEAGISQAHEMDKLEKIIQPTIGIFTNIGDQHNEGFLNVRHKINEKLNLFKHAECLIYNKDYEELNDCIVLFASKQKHKIKLITWSKKNEADLQVVEVKKEKVQTKMKGIYQNNEIEIIIPFIDDAYIEDSIHCWLIMLLLNINHDDIQTRMKKLTPIAMRLEMLKGINNCTLINDSYSSDISSLNIALDLLSQQNQHKKRTLILSDIFQSGKEIELYEEVADLLKQKKIQRFYGIGDMLMKYKNLFLENKKMASSFFKSTDDLIDQLDVNSFNDESILIKGARKFEFEKVTAELQERIHQTVLEINLDALIHNYKIYQTLLKKDTKVMAMVKAFSYGSGSFEVANKLQFEGVDYLAVAYTDEGILLRKNGINLPMMVMNADEHSFDQIIEYKLEPEIYNFKTLHKIIEATKEQGCIDYPIHIKLDTGMHRLGFDDVDINELIAILQMSKTVKVVSVFSHLSGSEEAELDEFTKLQSAMFIQLSDLLKEKLGYTFLRHLCNSSGIVRHAALHFDMVRLGLGLYGIDSSKKLTKKLQVVSKMKTVISQIKVVPATETVGYNRKGVLNRETKIGTVCVGYADGISRRLGNGVGKMLLNKTLVPIVGNVCMDMCMLDITDAGDIQEGETVQIFGNEILVSQLAEWAGTIPYEILTGISQRVKRVYFEE